MSTTIMHGRREGREKTSGFLPKVGMLAKRIDASKVAVLQPRDWQRIQNNLSKFNREAQNYEAQKKDRESLHAASKELVKHWENTIEGQRLKKLQSRKLREEQEELDRQKIDIEEAKLQAKQRKEAIDCAKKLQYYETDRVKGFHGALLLTEVLKERDAQIEMKNAKNDWKKERDAHLLSLQKQNLEASNRAERMKSMERFQHARDVADFQMKQVMDKTDMLSLDKEEDIKEGTAIKQQFATFQAAKNQIDAQNRRYKTVLMDTYKNEIVLKKEKENEDKELEEMNDNQIRKFVNAKRKMATMRKTKEQELFEAFQNHTEKMRLKLHEEMKQKVDDEDDRIIKTVAQREKERLEQEERKSKKQKESIKQMKEHRIQMMENTERMLHENKIKDKALLQQRVQSDKKFHSTVLSDRVKQRGKLSKLQGIHKDQMATKLEKANHLKNEQLALDDKNTKLLIKAEEIFQEYATKVIDDAKSGERNPFPLIKAAQEGPGGGRGPKFEGNAGLRPSYIVGDATGVQLPHYMKDEPTYLKTYGHVGKSGRRLGFTWQFNCYRIMGGETKEASTGPSESTAQECHHDDPEQPLPQGEPGEEPPMEEDDPMRLDTTEERRAQGKCCARVNRKLLISKAFYYFFFSAWGSLLPYLALYFKQLMLTPSQVGVIMGLKPFVNFLATPVWGALVDKFHIHRFALVISMFALITSTFALSLVPGPKQQLKILENHCNRTDEMTEMMALDGEPEIDKMVLLSDTNQDFYFSKSRWPWPLDFIASFEEDIYVKYKIDATKTFTSLFLITLFGTVIASPSLALVDTATLQMLGKETHRYGKQRLTGSLGWGMGAFIVGASLKTTHRCSMSKSREIVDYIPCFYVFAVLMTLGLVVSFKFKFSHAKKAGQSTSLSVGLVALKNPTYLMFLFTALYLGFLMAFIKTFLFWHLKDLGGTQLLFSVISAVNCVAEVSMYFLSEKLISKIGQVRVLYLGLICYSIRLFYYSIVPYTWLVLVVEILPGITTAAVWAACLSYVSINSKPGAQTTMQCILHGVHWGLGYGAGEVIGGILVHHYGAPTTFVMFGILCIVVLLLYILINMIWGEKDQSKRQDDETQTDRDGLVEKAAETESENPNEDKLDTKNKSDINNFNEQPEEKDFNEQPDEKEDKNKDNEKYSSNENLKDIHSNDNSPRSLSESYLKKQLSPNSSTEELVDKGAISQNNSPNDNKPKTGR